MATYTFESLLNKADGMTKVNEYVVQEKTLEIEGASWYHYAGNAANKLYINGKLDRWNLEDSLNFNCL